MDAALSLIKDVGVPVAILLLLFNYTTRHLIPELQKERSEAIKAFQDEMKSERQLHHDVIDKVVSSGHERDRMWMQMLSDLVLKLKA